MQSLASKHRPHTIGDVCGQNIILQILNKQIENKDFKHCYLFAGPSGVGKTTVARIFANLINDGKGHPIEIDAASNNGVDNIRNIIEQAQERSLDSPYKIFICDEAHMITQAGWNAFLKCLEEPPAYSIFIFCTTEPQKIPQTIQNRLMRFNLTRISTQEIENRLLYICKQEQFTNYEETCNYISRIANGGMRDAISLLDKCSTLSKDLTLSNCINILGTFDYSIFLTLTNNIVDRNEQGVLSIINDIYSAGSDVVVFINQYINVVLDLYKYCIFKDINVTEIPQTFAHPKFTGDVQCLDYVVAFENNVNYFSNLLNSLLNLKNTLKNDISPKTTISIYLLKCCKGDFNE